MLVNGRAGAITRARSETISSRKTNTVAANAAITRGFHDCIGSWRSAARPPAARPATSGVTASGEAAPMGMPTSSENAIARSTAPGARGCSETKASTRKTNGTRASPKAISGPPAGASGSSDDAATIPAMIDHNAGASTSVARMIARQRFCGDRGSMPPSPDRRDRRDTLNP